MNLLIIALLALLFVGGCFAGWLLDRFEFNICNKEFYNENEN